jgi:hypothetical protein
MVPSNTLAKLRKECAKALDMEEALQNGPAYFPHLSLFYGDLSTERRDELAEEAQGKLNSMALTAETEIVLAGIALVDCQGTVGDWKVIGQVDLWAWAACMGRVVL